MAGGITTKEGFEPNHREFGQHIRSEIARKPALLVAAKIARRANARAPFDPNRDPNDKSPRLKGSYKSGKDGNLKIGTNSRAIARVYSLVKHADPVEFGNKTTRAQHVLTGAAISVIITDLKGGANLRAAESSDDG